MKNRILTLTICVFCLAPQGFAQHVSVQEQTEILKTYKFSDPNPVATPSNLFYPYYRFLSGSRRKDMGSRGQDHQ